ncbi:MAG: NnrS family protein [Emcibacter sp.]|nr:NnrS family protein [Emcibacter sp.]
MNQQPQPKPQSQAGLFSGAIWSSAFRPFYLVGVVYGLGIMAVWVLTTFGGMDFPPAGYDMALWHGHEMVFGFSGAVVAGFVLTALPGWAGTTEIDRGRLALLVGLWFLGRVAVYSGGWMLPYMVMALDCSLFLVAMIMVLPGLLRAENKYFLLLIPILLLLFTGNMVFHLALMGGDMVWASWGIRLGLMGIVVKFIIAGGFLTTVFTQNALKQKGQAALRHNVPLEYASAISLGLFIYGALADVSGILSAGLAFIAAAVQFLRFLRWRILRILDEPLILIMHLSYLWFIAALILFGMAEFMPEISPNVWLHAFTVGALSMMMLSLITRVALRHTGRRLVPAKAMIAAFAMMFLAAIVRVAVALGLLPGDWLLVSALIWWGSFLLYLIFHGAFLLSPSLPRKALTVGAGKP